VQQPHTGTARDEVVPTFFFTQGGEALRSWAMWPCEEDARSLLEQNTMYGRVDILVNFVLVHCCGCPHFFEMMDTETWDEVINVNPRGTIPVPSHRARVMHGAEARRHSQPLLALWRQGC